VIALEVKADTAKARKKVERIAKGMTPEKIDPHVERVALQSMAELIKESPKRWFGQIRSGWRITTPTPGARIIEIPEDLRSANGKTSVADIARMVNFGTMNDGQGFIFPREAKALYIPLTRRAAAGWREGLVYGTDYILRKRARGIRGRHFIELERIKSQILFRHVMTQYVRSLVNIAALEDKVDK
jgi:hypothetical protein